MALDFSHHWGPSVLVFTVKDHLGECSVRFCDAMVGNGEFRYMGNFIPSFPARLRELPEHLSRIAEPPTTWTAGIMSEDEIRKVMIEPLPVTPHRTFELIIDPCPSDLARSLMGRWKTGVIEVDQLILDMPTSGFLRSATLIGQAKFFSHPPTPHRPDSCRTECIQTGRIMDPNHSPLPRIRFQGFMCLENESEPEPEPEPDPIVIREDLDRDKFNEYGAGIVRMADYRDGRA